MLWDTFYELQEQRLSCYVAWQLCINPQTNWVVATVIWNKGGHPPPANRASDLEDSKPTMDLFFLQNNEIRSCKSILKAAVWLTLRLARQPSNVASLVLLKDTLFKHHSQYFWFCRYYFGKLLLGTSDKSHLDLIWAEWPLWGWEGKNWGELVLYLFFFVSVHDGLCSHSVLSRWSLLIYKRHDYFIVLAPVSSELDWGAWEFTHSHSLKSNIVLPV